jgi:hypothetical protein
MTDEIIVVSAKASMVGGGAAAGASYAFSLNEYLAIGGFTVAVLGFVVNWYYAWKDDRRKEIESKIRLREMEV